MKRFQIKDGKNNEKWLLSYKEDFIKAYKNCNPFFSRKEMGKICKNRKELMQR